jgi:hypothetical protein
MQYIDINFVILLSLNESTKIFIVDKVVLITWCIFVEYDIFIFLNSATVSFEQYKNPIKCKHLLTLPIFNNTIGTSGIVATEI